MKTKFLIIYNIFLIPTGDTTLPDLDQIVEMAKDAQENSSQPCAPLPSSLEEIIQVDDDNDVQQAMAG